MTANLRDGPDPRGDYWEDLWRAVPEDAAPAGLELRLKFVRERLHMARAKRVLDVGCGEGQIAAALAHDGFEVVGVDLAEEPLRRARSQHVGLDVRRVGVGGAWPLADTSFDAVWSGETVEHVTDTALWMSEVRRVLRSGGVLALSTPAHGRLRMLGLALSVRGFDAHFDPCADHVRFYSSRTLASLLGEFGFESVRIARAGGPPLMRRTLLASAIRSRF
jgi:2-polyprenyl-3-methyl-5-hydroxy-6-metoxy-1,4-benzoquinol methylase